MEYYTSWPRYKSLVLKILRFEGGRGRRAFARGRSAAVPIDDHDGTEKNKYYRRWFSRPGSCPPGRLARLRSRPLRDAPHPLHRGPPDRRLRRTRLLQLAQVRVRKHRPLAAQTGDAPRRFHPEIG